jgi:hypothetical protein
VSIGFAPTASCAKLTSAEPDPPHLSLVFNISHTNGFRYTSVGHRLLNDELEQQRYQRSVACFASIVLLSVPGGRLSRNLPVSSRLVREEEENS